MLQFFVYEHLPQNLQDVSKDYCELARKVVDKYPQNAERTVTLRKLLEAKDAAVRTFLYKEE
jgi:3-methyladenine DNA glycosylase AlkC